MTSGSLTVAHPDTILTSVMYMMQSLTDLGMTYIHLSPDMQLYIQAMQIKWNEPQAFDKLILPTRRNAHCAKCLRVHWSVDDGLRSGGSHWLCIWRSWQHHGSVETMGACDALIQDGIFSSLAIIPADRFQDVG